MKKLFSVVLAVAMLVMSLTAFGSLQVSAAEQSLLPSDAASWVTKAAGSKGTETVTVSASGTGFLFAATEGWPQATYDFTANMIKLDSNSADIYINYDFTAANGTNIILFFNGQNPTEEDAGNNHKSLNQLIKTTLKDGEDLPSGDYKGSIPIASFKDVAGDDGTVQLSGIKVFAVGGNVTVNSMTVGGATQSTLAPAAATTTVAAAATTAAAGATTTAASSAKTGEESNALLFVGVAALAVAVIGVTAVASKKSRAK